MLSLFLLLLPALAQEATDHCEKDQCVQMFEGKTGPTDHWPVVEDANACKMDNCARQMASCILDPDCLFHLACPSSCSSVGEFTAGTCVFECTQAAAKAPVYVDMLTCWGENHCQENRAEPGGPCRALTPWEGVASITSLQQVRGDWWVSMAWQCGASGINFAKCQHWRVKPDEGKNLITFALAQEEVPLYKQLILHISLPYPGVLRHTYEGAFPNGPQIEDYHIIDSTDDHLLIIFCHGMPEANLNGALVLSRTQTSAPDDQTQERFKSQIAAHNMPLEDFCLFNNQECTNE